MANNTRTHNSYHLPMITTINTCTKYKLQQNRHTFTNYKKANCTQFTEAAFSDIQPPTYIHTANTIFKNIILHTDKHNISKGKIHVTCKLLPDTKIQHRKNTRAQNAFDPSISELNSEITSLIQTHKSDIWREHLDTHWDHKHNTHTLWKTIYGLANQYNTIPFKENTITSPTQITTAFNKHFTITLKHTTQTGTHIGKQTNYNQP